MPVKTAGIAKQEVEESFPPARRDAVAPSLQSNK
jgi:hypothetical protein